MAVKLTVARLRALEILDSRGNPTLEVEAELSDGAAASAQVPSGASTGRHEAVEKRDGDPDWYGGKGVRRAASAVEKVLSPALAGCDAEAPAAADRIMTELDGSAGKSRLGANVLLGASCAIARAGALSRKMRLWEWLGRTYPSAPPVLPVPMVNILSGNLHAGRNFEFQDFLAVPHGFGSFAESLHAAAAIHRQTRKILDWLGATLTGVADEGGWGPRLESNEKALEILTGAIGKAGYEPGRQVSIAIDVAASHFFRDGGYELESERRRLSSGEMAALLDGWRRHYPVVSIEDGLEQDDWEGWKLLTSALGSSTQLLGDDLFTTNPARLRRGIESGAANAVLVKMNQIGTLAETFEVLGLARAAGYRAVVSARSGETEDSFLADLAVASGAGQIKVGSVTRSERLSKYNRLLRIEAEGGLRFPGSSVFAGLL